MIVNKVNVLGLITARGGSKGIPGKNLAPLGGRPLLEWTARAAQASKHLDRVVLSTDGEDIRQAGMDMGIEAPFLRPDILAQDNSPHIPVIEHALKWLADNEDYRPDAVFLLQPTSPFRTTEDIDNAIDLLFSKEADSVVGLTSVRSHPALTKRLSEQGVISDFIEPPEGYLRRQDLEPLYEINGAVYVVRTDIFLDQLVLQTDNSVGYVMTEERSMDINTPWDLQLADLVAKNGGVS